MRKKQNEKRYSLIVAPKEIVAKELGKIRKSKPNKEALLKELQSELELSESQILELEKGHLENINHSSSIIFKYFNYIKATMQNLYKNEKYSVEIPNTKKQDNLGKKTYWMAIDAYTTQFKDKEDLLNDIRQNGYLQIDEDIPNNELWVFIEYPRINNPEVIDLIYSDNQTLVKFIKENKFASRFSQENETVSKFNTEIKEILRSHINSQADIEPEYRIFLKKYQRKYKKYYTPSLLAAKNWDEHYNENAIIGAACEYSNIRGNAIIKEAYQKIKDQIAENITPFNEPKEHKKPQTISNLEIKAIIPNPKIQKQTPIKLAIPEIGQQLQIEFEETKGSR